MYTLISVQDKTWNKPSENKCQRRVKNILRGLPQCSTYFCHYVISHYCNITIAPAQCLEPRSLLHLSAYLIKNVYIFQLKFIAKLKLLFLICRDFTHLIFNAPGLFFFISVSNCYFSSGNIIEYPFLPSATSHYGHSY